VGRFNASARLYLSTSEAKIRADVVLFNDEETDAGTDLQMKTHNA
jgi:hypothetical protein